MEEKVDNRNVVLLGIKSIFTTGTIEHSSHTLDQNNEQTFKAVAIRRLIWKLDRRLLPFLFFLEMIAFTDRASIGMHFFVGWLLLFGQLVVGHVQIMGIHIDMQMSPIHQYWFVSIFYLAYVKKGMFGR